MNEIFKSLAIAGDVWVLWILAAASVFSIAVMAERFIVFRRNTGDAAGLLDKLATHLENDDTQGAIKTAEESRSVEGKVAFFGLLHAAKGPASMEEAMTSKWLREKNTLEKYLPILATLGNNAPFIGLFGTVLGIIKAFNDLAVTGQSGIAVVMAGISSALIATAFGILVAIPAVMANNYFVTRLRQIQSNTESVSRILLAYMKRQRV